MCRAKLREIAAQRGVPLRLAIDLLVGTQEGYGLYVAVQNREHDGRHAWAPSY
jgi:hypothetical protein